MYLIEDELDHFIVPIYKNYAHFYDKMVGSGSELAKKFQIRLDPEFRIHNTRWYTLSFKFYELSIRRILTDQNERAHEFGEELLGDENLVLRDLLQTNVGQLQHSSAFVL
jgi:hypothetical protein